MAVKMTPRVLQTLSLLGFSLLHSMCLAQSTQPAPPLQPLPKPNSQCLLGMACASKDKGRLHTGVDYSVLPGTPVYSICDGVVHYDASKRADIWDRFLIVKHNDCGGYKTLFGYYGHIDSLVGSEGTKITKGQHIGSVKEWPGNTHLHFGISTRWFPSGWGYQAGGPLSNGWLDPNVFLNSTRASGSDHAALADQKSSTKQSDKLSGRVDATPIPVKYPGRTQGEHRNYGAFAALRADGSVITWGDPAFGGDSSAAANELRSGVVQIFSSGQGFAALKSDGSVVDWVGYEPDKTAAGQLRSGVRQIFSAVNAFAALKNNGSVVTWGDPEKGGNSSSVVSHLSSGVRTIFSTGWAFAALKSDGSVVTWGYAGHGGDSSSVEDRLRGGVQKIFSNDVAFVAIKKDGSIVSWPVWGGGGNIQLDIKRLHVGIIDIQATEYAFAALTKNGSAVAWGATSRGGDSSRVASRLQSGVKKLYSTWLDFAALKNDGSVVTWGYIDNHRSDMERSRIDNTLRSGVVEIFSTMAAFAALKNDGSVVTWGDTGRGGDSSAVATYLRSGVQKVFSTSTAFAALKSDGSVVTWGDPSSGGNSNGVASKLRSGVTDIFTTDSAFAALKSDGSVITWGDPNRGGDSKAVANQLINVVGFANPFTDDRLIYAAASATHSTRSHNALAKSRKRTVILGTGTWDMDSNRQRVCNDECDIWWELVDDRVQYLVPQNRASLAKINDTNFDRVDVKFLRRLEYKSDKIPSSLLAPGTIVGVRTNNGNFGKIIIISYRDLHDLNFADAEWLTSTSRNYILNEPNKSNAHLEVDWFLYK
jgi:murein DD-endopeptidase MepM/ murein hydrolase activator NlpD